MRPILPLLLFIIFTSNCLSQDRFFISLKASPTYSYRTVKSTNKHQIFKDFTNDIDEKESAKWGYRFGAEVRLQAASRISLGTGISFISIGEKVEVPDYYDSYIIKDGMMIPADRVDDSNQRFRYNYLSIPVIFQYQLIQKILSVNSFVSLNSDFLLNQKFSGSNIQKQFTKDAFLSYNDIVLTGTVGINLGYELNKFFTITINPAFTRSLTPNASYKLDAPDAFIPGDSKFKKYSFYFSSDIGLQYRIN
jgi:hypothetical protein